MCRIWAFAGNNLHLKRAAGWQTSVTHRGSTILEDRSVADESNVAVSLSDNVLGAQSVNGVTQMTSLSIPDGCHSANQSRC